MEGSELRELVKKLIQDTISQQQIGVTTPVTAGVVSAVHADGSMDVITLSGTLSGVTSPRTVSPVQQEQVTVISVGGRYLVL